MDSPPIFLSELASLVGGRLIGDGNAACYGAAPLYEVSAGQITLLDGPRHVHLLERAGAAAVVLRTPLPESPAGRNVINQIVVDQPHEAFAAIVMRFQPPAAEPAASVHPSASIDATAEIGADCSVGPNAVIGAGVKLGRGCRVSANVVIMDHVQIGDDCVLHPGVTVYERTIVQDRVMIHAGTVLGAYGFGYKTRDGRHVRTPQLGYVHIEDDVELGACVTIDRGTYGSTRIGAGTKIDNQVMIAHNCQIGRHNLICSQVGIAGSCRTGDHVILAGQVGLKDHVTLGDGVVVAAQSGVMDDLEGGKVYLGSPAMVQRDQMQVLAVQRRLPEIRRTLKDLERAVEQLSSAEDDPTSPSRCAA